MRSMNRRAKRHRSTLLVLVTLAGTSLWWAAGLDAQGFEGTVTQRSISVTSQGIQTLLGDVGDEVDMDALFAIPLERVLALAERGEHLARVETSEIRIKGSSLRAGMGEDGQGYVILDTEEGAMRMVDPAERMYVEMSAEQLEAMHAGMGAAVPGDEESEADIAVRRLGESRTVAGRRVDGYEVVESGVVTRAWIASGDEPLGRVMAAITEWSARMDGEEADGADARLLELGTPLLTQTYDGGWGGGEYHVEETLSITQEPLADDLFEVPAGYTRQSMFGTGGGR